MLVVQRGLIAVCQLNGLARSVAMLSDSISMYTLIAIGATKDNHKRISAQKITIINRVEHRIVRDHSTSNHKTPKRSCAKQACVIACLCR